MSFISSVIWCLGLLWVWAQTPNLEVLFDKAHLRWARAGFSAFMVPVLWVSFFPESQRIVVGLVSFAPAALALSLKLGAPSKWQRVPPLLRTGVYSFGFFAFSCVLIPKEIQRMTSGFAPPLALWITALLLCVASILLVPSFISFARAGGTPEPLDAPPTLVTDGFYRFLSHPILYGEILCFFVGVTLFPSVCGWVYAGTISLIIRFVWVPFEDKHLTPIL
jgi:protein-S-isoprenylcysteine O-methyltransferase Ste14